MEEAKPKSATKKLKKPNGVWAYLIRPRHPDFDAYWEEHKRLVYWAAKRCVRCFGGTVRDYWGTLVIKFNDILYVYDPEKGSKFSPFFMRYLFSFVSCYWMRFESESWNIFYFKSNTHPEWAKEVEVNYATHESGYFLYRVPEMDSLEIDAVLQCFNSQDEAWQFFTRGLDAKRRYVLERRYRYDETLQQIADVLHLTRERVRQLEAKALESIKRKIENIRAFAELFAREEYEKEQREKVGEAS